MCHSLPHITHYTCPYHPAHNPYATPCEQTVYTETQPNPHCWHEEPFTRDTTLVPVSPDHFCPNGYPPLDSHIPVEQRVSGVVGLHPFCAVHTPMAQRDAEAESESAAAAEVAGGVGGFGQVEELGSQWQGGWEGNNGNAEAEGDEDGVTLSGSDANALMREWLEVQDEETRRRGLAELEELERRGW